jgi:hypothetical protein
LKSKSKQVVLHPIMFAIYPVAFLYTGHKELIDFSAVYAPAAVSVAVASVIWLTLKKLLGDWDRASVAASAILMALFSYRPIVSSFHSLSEGGEVDVWNQIIGVCIVAAIAAAFFAMRSSKHLASINYGLNMASLLLVGGPLFQSAIWNFSMGSLESVLPDRTEFNANPLPAGTAGGPDIYYFVLDGYGREDFLREQYGFDNSAMTAALEQRGFAVPKEAVANYPFTLTSVNSSLNFSHLQDLFGDQLASASDQRFLRELMQNPRAVRLLKSARYKIVSFESEYWAANIGDVDVNLKEPWFLSSFSLRVLQMTVVPPLLQAFGYPILYDIHRERTAYPLEHIEEAVGQPGPKFVYSHMFFGHPPFVFGENGEQITPPSDYSWDHDPSTGKEFVAGYRAQVSYLNQRLLAAVDQILEQSEQEPIIIMHGDHGPSMNYDAESLENTDVDERYDIFYAAHLPAGGNADIYDSMSPVNGLRIVFNKYFGTDYKLLDDQAYYSLQSQPYEYVPVPGPAADQAAQVSEPPAASAGTPGSD